MRRAPAVCWRRLGVGGALAGALAWVAGCSWIEPLVTHDPAERFPRFSEDLGEPSALTRSRTQPGVYWTLSDSGGPAALWAVQVDGTVLGRFDIDGAANVDWEALAAAPDGTLWIGDVGNNRSDRTDLTVYAVAEPTLETATPGQRGRTAVTQQLAVTWPDQDAVPDPLQRFDCEAMVFVDRPRPPAVGDTATGAPEPWPSLLLLTKHRQDTESWAHRLDLASGRITRHATLDVGGADRPYGGQVSGAAITEGGDELLVLTYHAVLRYDLDPLLAGEAADRPAPTRTLDVHQQVAGQIESIAVDGEAVVVTNEDGRLFRAEPTDWTSDDPWPLQP